MWDIFEATARAIFIGISNLFYLAIAFFLLALLVKGKAVLSAIQKSFANSVFNIAVMSLNIVLVSPVVIVLSRSLTSSNFPTLDSSYWSHLPHPLVIFCAVFFGDFIGYWRHRLEHTFVLWPSHAVHHSDTQMTWLTLERFHPLNRLSTYLVDTTLLLLLGLPPYAIIANNLVRHYYGYFIHADLPWTYGAWGKIFVSPVMHRWHHAVDPEAHNTNFATVFSVFDRCFGTYRVPGVCDTELGVSSHLKSGLIKQLFYPLRPSSYLNKRKQKRSGE
jgi:sterol desaturase/sphingolipid hydroxylase (fatty acid hydroxylase superfamily)